MAEDENPSDAQQKIQVFFDTLLTRCATPPVPLPAAFRRVTRCARRVVGLSAVYVSDEEGVPIIEGPLE